MFFLMYPIGLDYKHRMTGFLSWVLIGLIFYRLALALIFPELRVQIIGYLPFESFSPETLTAILQSAFTPFMIPDKHPTEHVVLLVIGFVALMSFWLLFGVALEDAFGRIGFCVLYLTGIATGALLCMMPNMGISGVFWLGHAATLFALGVCYAYFFATDLKIRYLIWIFGGESSSGGTWMVPAFFLLLPMHLFLILPQSLYWYPETFSPLPIRTGQFTPLTWSIGIPALGFIYAIIWEKMKLTHEHVPGVLAR